VILAFLCFLQVLTAGQELAFDYQGDLFMLKPLSMMIASSQSKSASRGLLTDTTAITFEPAPGMYGELEQAHSFALLAAKLSACLYIYCILVMHWGRLPAWFVRVGVPVAQTDLASRHDMFMSWTAADGTEMK